MCNLNFNITDDDREMKFKFVLKAQTIVPFQMPLPQGPSDHTGESLFKRPMIFSLKLGGDTYFILVLVQMIYHKIMCHVMFGKLPASSKRSQGDVHKR